MEQPLHQMPHIWMKMRVEAIADLTLLNDKVLCLFCSDNASGLVDQFGV